MRAIAAALALLIPLSATAEPESFSAERERIRALEAHVANLSREIASLKASSPATRSRPSRAAASNALALLAIRQPLVASALGVPIFGARISNSSSVSSAGMPDPYTPTDGTMNVTGAFTSSLGITATAGHITSSLGSFTAGTQGQGLRDYQGAVVIEANGTTSPGLRLYGTPTDAAAAIAVRIAASADYTTSGAKIASFGDNAGTSYAEKAYVGLDGDVVTTSDFWITDTNVGLSESGTNDLALTADGAVVETLSSAGSVLAGTGAYSSTGAVGSGGTVNGIEIDYTVADFVATDTTPLDVTGISFTLDINDVYAISCSGRAIGALATAGIQVGLDLPASATVSAVCSSITTEQTRSFNTDDGFCAYTASFISPGAPYTLEAVVTMSSTAGDTKLRLRSETTDDATLGAGYKCEAKKLVNN